MAYTRHGHHIRGSINDEPPPLKRHRCGGPGLCVDCAQDEARFFGELDEDVSTQEVDKTQ